MKLVKVEILSEWIQLSIYYTDEDDEPHAARPSNNVAYKEYITGYKRIGYDEDGSVYIYVDTFVNRLGIPCDPTRAYAESKWVRRS